MFIKILLLIFLTSSLVLGDEYVWNNKTFPANFAFGFSSAAYQIEGGWNADGKGINLWDFICHNQSNLIADRSTGDIACDSYHKYKEDVSILKNLGSQFYRFSISWARILPKGTGDINQPGIQYYKNVLKEVIANKIEPYVTLYHFDIPIAIGFYDGGIISSKFPQWFADYARICFKEFGSQVKNWISFNEPQQFCKQSNSTEYYLCVHNVIKAHAMAYRIYEKEFKPTQKGRFSLINAISWYGPASNSAADKAAAEQAMEFYLGLLVNPLYYGDYPESVKTRLAKRCKLEGLKQCRLPEFTAEEKKMIKGTCDFFSINTYYSGWVKAIPEPAIVHPPTLTADTGVGIVNNPHYSNGAWGISPMMKWVEAKYNRPDILITENGYSTKDQSLQDDERIYYLKSYLSGVRDALADGVKVFGYLIWSFMDDFEWSEGYVTKMGLYHVDFNHPNRTRTPRKSASWFKKVTSTRCIVDKCI